MAVIHCAWCNSTDTQAGFAEVQCLTCGRLSLNGEQALPAEHTADLIGDPVMTETVPEPTPEPDPAPDSAETPEPVEEDD